jgi:hypothetical protein
MATNADDVQEDTQVTEADLAALKTKSEEVDEETQDESEETSEEETQEDAEATGEEDEQTDDQTAEEEQSESTFTKPDKFKWVKGDTPQEFADNLMAAYENSTSEALKWKKIAQDSKTSEESTNKPVDPALAYARQLMQTSIDTDIQDFSKEYSQMQDETQVAKIQGYVGVVSEAIQRAEDGRIPSMKECLEKSAVILGWQKTDKQEQVGAAVKNGAATTKTNSATKQTPQSKVSDKQVLVARKTWGANKSDAEIRKELEIYV